jgi:hypothetical protein
MNNKTNKLKGLIIPNSDNPITDPSRVLINVSITIAVLLVLFFIGILDSVVR